MLARRRGQVSVVSEETHIEVVGKYTSRMKCCHVRVITQYKQNLDIEPLSLVAMIGERCEKMKYKLTRTLFTIQHTYEQVLESDRVSDRVFERSGPREDVVIQGPPNNCRYSRIRAHRF
jgi:hypothetical protein